MIVRGAHRLLVLAAVALALPTFAAAAVAAPRPPATIKLVSVTASVRTTDRPPKGTSNGDTVRETSVLFNQVAQFGKPARAAVGKDRAVQRLRVKPRSTMIDGVATLPGGTLRFRGTATRSVRGGFVIPVVSGTGRYLGAEGTLWIVSIGGTGRALNVYRLTYALFA
jgi:hypothetical protein